MRRRLVISLPRPIESWIARRTGSDPARAGGFIEPPEGRSVGSSVGRNSASPGLRAPDLSGVRCATVDEFRSHLIFYRAGEDEVSILHVVHGARDLDSMFGPREGEGRDLL